MGSNLLQEPVTNNCQMPQPGMGKTESKCFIDVDSYKCRVKQSMPRSWIPEFGLSVKDRRVIASPHGWLTDAIIDGAQKMMKLENPALPGLQEVVTAQVQGLDVVTGEFVQVLHDGEGHWVTVSSIGLKHPAEVLVYDSKYSSASESLKTQIASLLHTEYPVIKLHYRDVQKQEGSSDCGLYALAFATALIFGRKPEECSFNQSLMRAHLLQCFEERKISCFH